MDDNICSSKKKKSHPRERTNIIFRTFFCWFIPFLAKGLKNDIDENDMYSIEKSHESSVLGNKLEFAWNKEQRKNTPSLTRALLTVFKGEIAFYLFIDIIIDVGKIGQPLFVFKLVSSFQDDARKQKTAEAYTYATLIILSSLIQCLCNHNYFMWMATLGMKIRIAVCSVMYRKSLKMSKSALAQTTIGQMVNLMTNDVARFEMIMHGLHHLWMVPMEVVIIMIMLYCFVGHTALLGALLLLSSIPLQIYIAKLISKYRLRTATHTDERIRLMNEIITGILVIKMYTWEKPFAKIVESIRRKEIDQIRASFTVRAIMMSLNSVMYKIAICICILTFVLTGNTLTATYAYTVYSFYGVLKSAVTTHFPKAITQTSETKVSIERIEKFLRYDERSKVVEIQSEVSLNRMSEKKTNNKNVEIHLKDLSVKWLESLPKNTLESITFKVTSDHLVAVVGQVGSGKTTLLHAILKELYPTDGSMEVHGEISYASQEPWVFGGSVRQNILFGLDYDAKKYGEVIRVCALQRDLAILPHGDQTMVGERGTTLSGGQKARINLARAVYKEADIYLLDDPLSAVDTNVGKQLFDNCICEYLKNKCVVLVTHQLQYLRNAQSIYLLEDGKVRSTGTYQELHIAGDFTSSLTESEDREQIDRNPSFSELEQEDNTAVEESTPLTSGKEQTNTGIVAWHVYRTYFRAGGECCKTTIIFLGFLLTQTFLSCSDYFLSRWVNLGEMKQDMKSLVTGALNYSSFNGTVQQTIHSFHTDSGDSWSSNLTLTEKSSMYVYCSLIVLAVFTAILRSITYYNFCITASRRLHDSMFTKIIHSPIEFFNKNPTGRILNRFSKDVGAVDEILPTTSFDSIDIGLIGIATSLVIATVNPWSLLPTVIIIVIFYLIQQAHLTSSRTIKRVEAISRSPVYTHLAASLQGLTTIRAFGAEKNLRKEFDRHQDTHTSAYYLFISANNAFSFWLDLHCVIYISLVIMSILFLHYESDVGNIGLSLTQSMLITGMFQWGMRQWAEFETQMTSVERIQEYADIVPERDDYSKDPPKSWPDKGKINFVNLYLKYSENDRDALENVHFEVNPQEKIGIVGRTGAGKTSLILALFRLAHTNGSILIDDVDIKTLPLKAIRSKISIIPQDPVLFSGTLRENLDPFDEYKDEKLWNALEDVELKNIVKELSAGLDAKMAESGSNFSVGQRQLICLARAILRNNKILVLDEATANVDPDTDALIQNTIRKKFTNCTVLTIAHRLHTIMDSDKVLVMDAGRVVEFDHPSALLQNKNGVFRRLVEQTGISAAKNLSSIAERNILGISKPTTT